MFDRWRPIFVVPFLAYVGFLAYVLLQSDAALASSVVRSTAQLLVEAGAPAEVVTLVRVEFALNAAMFVPLIMLAALTFPRVHWAIWVVAGFSVSAAVEVTQGLFLPLRSAQFVDVVSNTLGALVGAVLVAPLNWRWRRRRRFEDSPAPLSSFGHSDEVDRQHGEASLVTARGIVGVVRRRRTALLMLLDAGALVVAYIVATMVRYDGLVTGRPDVTHIVIITGVAVVMQWVCGWVWGTYKGRVAVASIEETLYHGLATATAGSLIFVANAFTDPLWTARSVPLTATFVALVVMLTARALWRYRTDHLFFTAGEEAKPTIIVGAGYSGTRLARSMLSHPEFKMVPVAFVDDDPWKRRRRTFGIKVMGTLDDLEDLVDETMAQVVVVAIPSAPKRLVGPLVERAKVMGVDLKVLPSIAENVDGGADVRDVRDVNMLDILGRSAIETDIASIAGYVTGKRVLVTGAGGSIGSELSRQISRYNPAELIMLDRDESALHAVQLSIHGRALLDSKDVVLNDIRDLLALRRIFEDRRPEVVFHAAALKHLPMLEQYPHEAMKTNVLGTANVLDAAAAVGVETFVNISTDKAADPTSVLGYSKRIAERLTASMSRQAPGTYISVRFGNVLGSRGSVLHTFTAQIAAGGPVTVVHPEVERYFMTVEEAVQLVIQAGALGENGEVMILDMGEPVKINDVARQLIAISGKDIEIVYTGLREGEKLSEQLFGGAESDERSKHPLVSHAPVTPLAASTIRAYDIDRISHLGLLEVFEEWIEGTDASLAQAGHKANGASHAEATGTTLRLRSVRS